MLFGAVRWFLSHPNGTYGLPELPRDAYADDIPLLGRENHVLDQIRRSPRHSLTIATQM